MGCLFLVFARPQFSVWLRLARIVDLGCSQPYARVQTTSLSGRDLVFPWGGGTAEGT